MSGEENYTLTYDYSSYLDGPSETPCNTTSLKEFVKVFLPILYSLVFILGFIGNGLVVCIVVKYRNQTTLTDICLFNLALSDLLFIFTLPFYTHYSVVGQWTFGDFMCRFMSGSHQIGFFGSIFFMVVMALERYVVMMSLKLAHYSTLKVDGKLTIFVWILSISVSLPALIFSNVTKESEGLVCKYVPENDNWRLYSIFATNVLGLVVPLVIMIVCYCRIIPLILNLKNARGHRIVKMIISIVIAFFLFWTPFNISIFLVFLKSEGKLSDDCDVEAHLSMSEIVTQTFAYTHCCLNPIIYAFVGQKFRRRALRLLRDWMPRKLFPLITHLSDRSRRKSSVTSRSSNVTSNFIM